MLKMFECWQLLMVHPHVKLLERCLLSIVSQASPVVQQYMAKDSVQCKHKLSG